MSLNVFNELKKLDVPGKKMTNGKLLPILKCAIDKNNVRCIQYICKTYPNTLTSSKKYLGQMRLEKMQKLIAR